jgi:VCBS repeat-containing protein
MKAQGTGSKMLTAGDATLKFARLSASLFTLIALSGCIQGEAFVDLDFAPGASRELAGSASSTPAANTLPVIGANQSASVTEGGSVNITLSSATDADGDTLAYSVVSAPAHGTLTHCMGQAGSSGSSDRTCTYTPTASYSGSDSFTYKANDGTADSAAAATVSITVNAAAGAPVIGANQTATTNEDTATTFTLNAATDPNGDTLTYAVVTAPSNGTLTNCMGETGSSGGTDRTCTYTPNANWNGTDTFTYKANDGTADSVANATVTITVSAVADVPVIGANQSVSTNEDTAAAFTLNAASDGDGDTLTYALVSGPSNGTLANCMIQAGSSGGPDRTCTYTPNANWNGTDTFTYKANDGTSDTAANATVTITVSAVQDVPVIGANQSATTNEDAAVAITLNAATDADSGDTLSYSLVTAPAHGTLINCMGEAGSSGATDRTCGYTPDANWNGTDTFTYKANDGTADTAANATVTITVSAASDIPIIGADQSATTNEDTAATLTLNAATDADGDTLSYSIVASPSNGTLTNCMGQAGSSGATDRTCTYTPNANWNGTDTFTYKASDSSADTAANATVTITVTAVNDLPTLGADQSTSVQQDGSGTVTLNAGSDTEGSALSYSIVASPAHGALTDCMGQSGSSGATDRTCTFTPTAGYGGSDSFTYKANDGTADSAGVATVTININPGPTITLGSFTGGDGYLGGSTQAITWTATDDVAMGVNPITIQYSTNSGSSWTDIATGEANDGTYSWALPSIDSSTVRIKITAVDATGVSNSKTSTSDFAIDTTAPTVTAGQMAIQEGATTSSKNIHISLQASDNVSKVTHFCFKYVNSEPTASSACWKSVATDASLTPATTLALSNFAYSLGETDGAYTVYAWVKNGAGLVSTLTNAGAGTTSTDKAATTLTFSCPYTLPGSVTVAHAYANYTKWNDYVKRDIPTNRNWAQTDTVGNACVGTETSFMSCVHAGIIKKVAVTGINSCYGLSIADAQGVYNWVCDASSGTATFYTQGLKRGKGLRNLVNASSWKSNEVTVSCGAFSSSSTSTTWYTNTVAPLPDNSSTSASHIVLDGTDNDGAGVDQVYTAGTIFTLASSRASTGYNIKLHQVAIVTLPGATLSYTGVDANTDGVPDASNTVLNTANAAIPCTGCDSTALISFGSTAAAKFLWLEGDFKGDNGTLAATQVIHSRNGTFTRYQNLNARTLSSAYAIRHVSSGVQMFEDVRAQSGVIGGSGGTAIYAGTTAGGLYKDISVSGSNIGLSVYPATSSVVRNVVAAGNSTGIYSRQSPGSYFTQLTAFNNATGLSTSSNNTTYAFVTLANNSTTGFTSAASTATGLFYQVSSIANNHGFTSATPGYATLRNFYINHNASQVFYLTSTTDFLSFLENGYIAGNCTNSASGTNNNLTAVSNGTCSKNDGSQAFQAAGSSTASYVGMITTTDGTNASAVSGTGTKAVASITDWTDFDNLYRGWGKDSSNALWNADQRGACTSGTCHVWDFTLASGDTRFKNKSGDGTTTNGTWEDGENCPAELDGSNTLTDANSTPGTFLKNALEVMNDGIGNDNGFCESSEACIYAPNFANSYQGSGDYTKHSCVFKDGTITGVTMYKYPTN